MTMTERDPQLKQSEAPLLAEKPVEWQGIHHLALITNDMDSTVRFWHGVLGAELISTIGTDSFLHYFFRAGPNCTVAFFQYLDNHVDQIAKPAGVFDRRACHFDHLALNVADINELENVRRRLIDAGCEVTEVVDHKIMKSIYFTDPNGIALETSCWVHDPTHGPVDYDDTTYFADRDPVPAVRELRDGELTFTPATKLV